MDKKKVKGKIEDNILLVYKEEIGGLRVVFGGIGYIVFILYFKVS